MIKPMRGFYRCQACGLTRLLTPPLCDECRGQPEPVTPAAPPFRLGEETNVCASCGGSGRRAYLIINQGQEDEYEVPYWTHDDPNFSCSKQVA